MIGKPSWVVWMCSVMIGFIQSFVYAEIAGLTHRSRVERPSTGRRRGSVIIISVGASQRPHSRLNDLRESGAILKEVIREVARQEPKGVLLIASNPVDALTHAAWRWSGLPVNRVVGSGTSLDTSRFRRRIAEHYGVAADNVHAYILGEHGDSQVALLSSARIAGTSLEEFCRERRLPCDDSGLRAIANEMRNGGLQIIRSKGATQYGISAVLTRMVRAILRDEHAVLTVSNLAPAQMNVGEVFLSAPAIITRDGVDRVLPVQLNEEEGRRAKSTPFFDADLSRCSGASLKALGELYVRAVIP